MLRTLDEAAVGMKVGSAIPQGRLLAAYGTFALVAWGIYETIAERHFASILTVSVIVQLLAMVFLALQVMTQKSAIGISTRMLTLYAAGIAFKLSSTMWLNGYLPVDATGDFVFQATDVCSLLIVLWILYTAKTETRARSAEDKDDLSVVPVVIVSLFVAALMHGDMNARPLFDTLWMTGLLVDNLAVAPQLWLITRSGGRIEGMTGHHMAAMALSRVCSLAFFWEAWHDITCAPYVEGFNQAIWTIVLTHVAHLILIADFVFFYAKAALRNGLGSTVELQAWHDM